MKRISLILLSVIVLGTTITCTSRRKDIELVDQGKTLFLEEKYDEAIPYFSKAIRKNNQNDDAYSYRGLCYFWLENYKEAVSNFSKAFELNPYNETALFGNARILWNLEEYPLAFQEFNRLIQINPNHEKAYYYRGRAFLYQGDTINGLNDLSFAMEKEI